MEDPYPPVVVAQLTADLGWSPLRCWALAGLGAVLVALGGFLYSDDGSAADANFPVHAAEYR
jgi:hypothetical protein